MVRFLDAPVHHVEDGVGRGRRAGHCPDRSGLARDEQHVAEQGHRVLDFERLAVLQVGGDGGGGGRGLSWRALYVVTFAPL